MILKQLLVVGIGRGQDDIPLLPGPGRSASPQRLGFEQSLAMHVQQDGFSVAMEYLVAGRLECRPDRATADFQARPNRAADTGAHQADCGPPGAADRLE